MPDIYSRHGTKDNHLELVLLVQLLNILSKLLKSIQSLSILHNDIGLGHRDERQRIDDNARPFRKDDANPTCYTSILANGKFTGKLTFGGEILKEGKVVQHASGFR